MKNQRKAGVVLTYLAQGVHIVSGLLYTPIMLRLLGQSEYGIYQLAYSTISYLSVLNLGFNSSYIRFYARERIGDDKEKKIRNLNGMFLLIFSVLSLVCIAAGTVLVLNTESIFGSGLNAQEISKAKILMGFMVFNMALGLPSSLFDCYIGANECFIFQKALQLLQSILNPFLSLPLLMLGYGSMGMVSVVTFLTVAKFLCNCFYAIRKLQMRFAFRHMSFSLFKEMGSFTFFIFINMIVDQINWNLDKFLLGRFSGSIAVAVYGVASNLQNLYAQLSSAVSNVFVPKVNYLVSSGNKDDQINALFCKVGRVQFLVLMPVLLGFIFFGRAFIGFWAGKGYEHSYSITLLLIIPFTIALVQTLGVEIQRAKNLHRTRSIVYFCVAIANILVSIPCIKAWGEQGAAFGTALTYLIGCGLFMNWYYQNRVGLDIRCFWKTLFSLVPGMIPAILIGVFSQMLDLNTPYVFVCCGFTFVVFYIVGIYLFNLNLEEKSMLQRFLPRRKK